jgi:hypothetical protein
MNLKKEKLQIIVYNVLNIKHNFYIVISILINFPPTLCGHVFNLKLHKTEVQGLFTTLLFIVL